MSKVSPDAMSFAAHMLSQGLDPNEFNGNRAIEDYLLLSQAISLKRIADTLEKMLVVHEESLIESVKR